MTRYTQRAIKNLVATGMATDITDGSLITRATILEIEDGYTHIGYSVGVCGLNAMLIRGDKTGALYAITGRTTAIFIF